MPTDSRNSQALIPVEQQVRDQAAASAGLSMLASFCLPGLGQALQRRWIPGVIHFGAVASYLITAHQAGWGRAGWLAIAWNLWSGVDAYWHERGRGPRPQPGEELKPPAAPGSLVE